MSEHIPSQESVDEWLNESIEHKYIFASWSARDIAEDMQRNDPECERTPIDALDRLVKKWLKQREEAKP